MDCCPDCGAAVAGREACQQLWDDISLLSYTNPGYARTHDLGFDAYCMQHPIYTRSAKSYAAHLTRLCCGLEYNGSQSVYAAIRSWLDGRVKLQKPPAPESVGNITVYHVWEAADAHEHHLRVQTWAQAVWTAYESQHALAHSWIQQALAAKTRA